MERTRLTKARHWQYDSLRLPLSAWAGVDSGLVFGVKLVLTKTEASTSFEGRCFVLWLGPVYCGVEIDGKRDRARCPDCEIGPDPGDDGECPICADREDTNRRIRDAYDAGYEDARGR